MKDKIIGFYRRLKHKITYDDSYFYKVIRICIIGLIICIGMIFILGWGDNNE